MKLAAITKRDIYTHIYIYIWKLLVSFCALISHIAHLKSIFSMATFPSDGNKPIADWQQCITRVVHRCEINHSIWNRWMREHLPTTFNFSNKSFIVFSHFSIFIWHRFYMIRCEIHVWPMQPSNYIIVCWKFQLEFHVFEATHMVFISNRNSDTHS